MSNISISTRLSGLMPFEKYDYTFQGMGGNWPCVITPLSGTIRPYGDSVNIDATVHFCTTKTSCPTGTVGFLPYSTGICDSNPNLYTSIRLSLKPETLVHTLYSDIKTVKCDSCFAQPVINTPQTVTLSSAQGNEYILSTTIVGLQPNQIYTYNITSLEANWPIKVSPVSGTIKVSKDRTTLTNNVMFCESTGLCPSGQDVLDYSINSACLAEKNYYGLLQIELNNTECSLGSVYSNTIPLYCRDCLPSVDMKLFSSNKKIMTVAENIIGLMLEPTISGLKPDHEYQYTYKSLGANWPVYMNPVSGILKSSSSNTTLSSQLFFCASTGICQSGTRGVLNYSSDEISSNKINNDPFINLQLELTDTSCSETHKSDTLLIYCNDCIPKPDVRIISNRVT
jgi:hypothetical protein